MKRLYIIITILLLSNLVFGQDKKSNNKALDSTKHGHTLSLNIGSGGMKLGTTTISKDSTGKKVEKENDSRFSSHFLLLDLGFNFIQDKTDYNSVGAQKALANVDPAKRNSSLFDLRTAKSINVNFWPYMLEYKALKTKHQSINIVTGIGMQFYNFRYDNAVTYTKKPSIFVDSISFSKNKVALDYLTIPLMVNFKTKIFDKKWLVYGAGITGGMRIASWTKQISSEQGKVKVHDGFDFQDFNSCVTGEIGIEGVLRFYASYQLTSLYRDGLDQHPVCIGIKILGI